MEYYHDIVTQKSWQELQELKRKLDFVLIGGWAVYLHTKSLKSKDIDIIVDFDKLPVLRKEYALYKNERLSKYEAVKGEVQIDIYLPHFSKLGIPAEILIKNSQNVDGFDVLNKEFLLALKVYVLSQRARTAKGQKDFIDVVALVNSDESILEKAKKVLLEYKLENSLGFLKELAEETYEVPELNLTKHSFSKLRRLILS